MAQQPNRISLDLDKKEQDIINNHIKGLQETLKSHLKSLTPEDRKELPKMGDKTFVFVQKALEQSEKNPELVPSYLNMGEFKKDIEAFALLRELLQPLQVLTRLLEDSMMLSGSEAYQAALIFYGAVKGAAKSNIPGAETIYKDLVSRFPGGGRKKK